MNTDSVNIEKNKTSKTEYTVSYRNLAIMVAKTRKTSNVNDNGLACFSGFDKKPLFYAFWGIVTT